MQSNEKLALGKINWNNDEWVIVIHSLICDDFGVNRPVFGWDKVYGETDTEIETIFKTYGGYIDESFYCIKDWDQGQKFIEEMESRRTMAELTQNAD